MSGVTQTNFRTFQVLERRNNQNQKHEISAKSSNNNNYQYFNDNQVQSLYIPKNNENVSLNRKIIERIPYENKNEKEMIEKEKDLIKNLTNDIESNNTKQGKKMIPIEITNESKNVTTKTKERPKMDPNRKLEPITGKKILGLESDNKMKVDNRITEKSRREESIKTDEMKQKNKNDSFNMPGLMEEDENDIDQNEVLNEQLKTDDFKNISNIEEMDFDEPNKTNEENNTNNEHNNYNPYKETKPNISSSNTFLDNSPIGRKLIKSDNPESPDLKLNKISFQEEIKENNCIDKSIADNTSIEKNNDANIIDKNFADNMSIDKIIKSEKDIYEEFNNKLEPNTDNIIDNNNVTNKNNNQSANKFINIVEEEEENYGFDIEDNNENKEVEDENHVTNNIEYIDNKTDSIINNISDPVAHIIEMHADKDHEHNHHRNLDVIKEESLDKSTNREDTSIVISFYSDYIDNFEQEYQNYIEHINEEQKIAFKISTSIRIYTKGINPKIMLAYNKGSNNIIGLCCVSYDANYDQSLRLVITHFSTNKYDILENVLFEFKEFIINNLVYDDLFIGLYYEFKNNSFKVNTYIRDILKDKLKFKWSTLDNKPGERLQKMFLKNTTERTALQTIEVKEYKHLLNIKYATVINIEEDDSSQKEYIHKAEEKMINVFPLIYSLVELKSKNFTIECENFKTFNVEQIKVYTFIKK